MCGAKEYLSTVLSDMFGFLTWVSFESHYGQAFGFVVVEPNVTQIFAISTLREETKRNTK